MKQVPVIMQMEAVECGAASLCMVLATYGRWVPLEQMRQDCGVSRDGVNALSILKAARYHGLEAHGLRCETSDLRELDYPCIIHWGFKHFVVLRGFRGSKALINDPARGSVNVPYEELDQEFSGVAMTFAPGPEFQREGKPASVLSFVHKRLEGTREALIYTFLTGVLALLPALTLPLFSQIFTDVLLQGRNADWKTPFLLLMGVVVAFQIIIEFLNSFYAAKLTTRMAIRANSQFLWHVLRLPKGFFDQRYTGDIMMRMDTAESIPTTLVQTLAPLLINVVMLLIYLAIMLLYSVPLTLIAVSATFLNIVLLRFITRIQINQGRVMMRNQAQLGSVTMSSIKGIETIKAAGAEDGFFHRWAGFFSLSTNATISNTKLNLYLGLIPQLLVGISNNIILALGAYYILKGELTIGMLMAFQGFAGAFQAPVSTLIGSVQQLLNMRTDMERMEDVYRYKTDVESTLEDNRPMPDFGKLSGEVELRNVTFGYSALAAPLIENFSLHLNPGQSVAFVGPSGCGKSTMTKLISGLYEPWSGQVLFDGMTHNEMNRNLFVGSVAVVNQEIVLFEGTIADNIRLWDSSIEDFCVILAANDAQMHHDIASRPQAYETPVIENGKNLSGGQRQRIEIAAALAKEPVILILDEATSALDAETEDRVMKAIKQLGITLIIIAHRLSTIRDCDEIIVMDQGKIVERGNHEGLMEKQGYYYNLMQS